MIKLFESTAKVFDTLGLGVLNDALKCEVTEERNGAFELEMEYPIDGIHYSDISLRSIVVCKPNPYKDEQAFRVYYISKPISGIVLIKAEHISYDLSGYVVSPFEAANTANALIGLKNNSVPVCDFNFSTDKEVQANFKVSVPSSLRSLLGGVQGSILDVYGTGEYEFDNYNVRFLTHRGMDRGVTIRYGKNLTDLTQEENCSKVYTAIYPFWSGTKYEDEKSEDILVTLPEKTVDVEGTFSFSRIYPLDAGENFNEMPTVDQLRQYAQSYINQNGIGKPDVSLKVSFIQLEQAEEYEQLRLLESVYLCDEVTVIFEELGVNSTAKCIKTVYNAITDKYESLEFGSTRTNLANTIVGQSEAIANAPTASFMEQEIKKSTEMITQNGLGGYVMLHRSAGQKAPDELLILDENSEGEIEKSQNVWRWNKEGLGFSDKGYDGPYAKIALTKDGRVVADQIAASGITAGTITAAINIIAPYITDNADKSKAQFYLDSEKRIIYGATITASSFGDGNASSTTKINIKSDTNTRLAFGGPKGAGYPYGCNILTGDYDKTGYDDGFATVLSSDQKVLTVVHYDNVRRYWHNGVVSQAVQWGNDDRSDIRLKKYIKDIDSESIRKFFRNLRPVSFKYNKKHKRKTDDRREYGYIAQEVLPLVNECGLEETQFVTTDNEGYYELTYSNINRLASMGVHELFVLVEQLENKVEKLQNEVNELKRGDQVE